MKYQVRWWEDSFYKHFLAGVLSMPCATCRAPAGLACLDLKEPRKRRKRPHKLRTQRQEDRVETNRLVQFLEKQRKEDLDRYVKELILNFWGDRL